MKRRRLIKATSIAILTAGCVSGQALAQAPDLSKVLTPRNAPNWYVEARIAEVLTYSGCAMVELVIAYKKADGTKGSPIPRPNQNVGSIGIKDVDIDLSGPNAGSFRRRTYTPNSGTFEFCASNNPGPDVGEIKITYPRPSLPSDLKFPGAEFFAVLPLRRGQTFIGVPPTYTPLALNPLRRVGPPPVPTGKVHTPQKATP